jgi:glycosyltransferase involved in cell wall biosynthesis
MTVAVILTSYNQENYIKFALDGLRLQTVQPNEVVIADDGSTDNTQEIILKYVIDYELHNWKLLLSKFNRGININLQEAFDHTNSDIIIGMAGDDVSLPNRVKDSVLIFEKQDVDIVNLSGTLINEKGDEVGSIINKPSIVKDVKKALLLGNPLVNPVGHAIKSYIFSDFGKLPQNLPNEDDQLTFRALVNKGIYCSPIMAYKYRIHYNSESAWLRNIIKGNVYYDRFVKDIDIRTSHIELWIEVINSSNLEKKMELNMIAKVKINYLKLLKSGSAVSLYLRLNFIIHNIKYLKFKEIFYLLFAKSGIIFWYNFRNSVGRFKY